MASAQAVTQPVQQTAPRHYAQRRHPRGHGNQHQPIPSLTQTTQNPESSTDLPPSWNASLVFRPASVAPHTPSSSKEPSSAEGSATENGKLNGSRGRGRGRNRGRGIGRGGDLRGGRGYNGSIIRPGRQFGGQLTATEEPQSSTQATSTLQADAPEFLPGQPHQQRSTPKRGGKPVQTPLPKPHPKAPRARRASILKSTASDIATRTHEDITNQVYECPICTNEVNPNSKVWSCKTCWTVFHLSCIKKWSTNEGSTLAQQRTETGDLPPPRQWRCPGCNLPKDVLPSNYTCWCTKEADPRPISGIPPHSCGQTCGKHRALPQKCPHPCELLCHAGPCPPCTHMGPVQMCFCGKKSTSRRCVETNYESGWSCGGVCGDPMPCGEHTCQSPCHEGLCGACEVPMDCRCYCGKEKETIVCCERGAEKWSQRTVVEGDQSEVSEWMGSFACGNECQRLYDCGLHHCEKKCHPQEIEAPHCPYAPDVVSRCPCGKTLLDEILGTPRKSCQDLMPNCKEQCLKKLLCGHVCQEVCHSGECKPCLSNMEISCRCGRTKSMTICHQGTEEPPQCTRACRATLNCGRHECGERCCSGERKAADRQATKRKLKPLGASRIIDEGFEAEHICTRPCGRMLKCGGHTCLELCHKGPCGSCREAIFDEISCHCGKTVLQPPLPCGTPSPPCRFECERPKNCGHPRVPHNCHGNEENCPKCPFLGVKPCICGKNSLKNQPCWLTEVRCGEICGKKLKCGSHFCRKQCHRPGECEDTGRTCQQLCGKAKKACGHPCEEPCHAPAACREDKPCQNKMFVTCDCQHIKQEIKCNASKASEGNTKKTLPCDDECARLARNQTLALALNVDPESHKDDHIPYSNETLKMFREHSKWAQTQEREFRVFATDETEKRLRFKPMPPSQHAFLHSLSEDFGFDSESMDPEPHRHIAVFKTPRFVKAPMKTLAECVRIRISTETATLTTAEGQRKLHISLDPFNGFLLTHPRFGLTLEELHAEFAAILSTTSSLNFDISFLPSEEIVLKARPSTSTSFPSSSIDHSLRTLKPALLSATTSKNIANTIQLCTLDPSLNVLRRESDETQNQGGWSQVAAKAAAPRGVLRRDVVGEKNVYTVLGSRLRDARKKKEKEEVVEDWEEEANKGGDGAGSNGGVADVGNDAVAEKAAGGLEEGPEVVGGTGGEDVKEHVDGEKMA